MHPQKKPLIRIWLNSKIQRVKNATEGPLQHWGKCFAAFPRSNYTICYFPHNFVLSHKFSIQTAGTIRWRVFWQFCKALCNIALKRAIQKKKKRLKMEHWWCISKYPQQLRTRSLRSPGTGSSTNGTSIHLIIYQRIQEFPVVFFLQPGNVS